MDAKFFTNVEQSQRLWSAEVHTGMDWWWVKHLTGEERILHQMQIDSMSSDVVKICPAFRLDELLDMLKKVTEHYADIMILLLPQIYSVSVAIRHDVEVRAGSDVFVCTYMGLAPEYFENASLCAAVADALLYCVGKGVYKSDI